MIQTSLRIKKSRVMSKITIFPRLLQMVEKEIAEDNILVVLFTSNNTGTLLIDTENPSNIGRTHSRWDMSLFTEYNDEIVINNQ